MKTAGEWPHHETWKKSALLGTSVVWVGEGNWKNFRIVMKKPNGTWETPNHPARKGKTCGKEETEKKNCGKKNPKKTKSGKKPYLA